MFHRQVSVAWPGADNLADYLVVSEEQEGDKNGPHFTLWSTDHQASVSLSKQGFTVTVEYPFLLQQKTPEW